MRSLGSSVQALLYRVDREWGRAFRRARRRLGWARPAAVHAYRGYAIDGTARILARVLEERDAGEWAQGASLVRAAKASWRRYATFEVPEAYVDVRWGEVSAGADTDEEGHLDARIPVPETAGPGWNVARITVPKSGRSAAAHVYSPPEDARFVVVSDIDDTVIDTNVRHPLERAAALFLTDARTRMPFEGVGALYRALHDGRNPMIYLSSSPWNLYDHLEGLFERHRMPEGVLLLREWGVRKDGIAPLGGHGHKREQLDRLLEDFAERPFVLIGDSGQHDAIHYVEVAEANPGRVRAIVIRDVGTRRRRRLERLGRRAREAGVPFRVAEDTVEAARFLADEGLIAPSEVARVSGEKARDERAPGAVSEALQSGPATERPGYQGST